MAASISDQLLKMGLVDEKQAKKAKHQQRQDNKKKGRRGVEASRMDRRAALEANRQNASQKDRARELERQEQSNRHAEQHRILQIIQSGTVKGGPVDESDYDGRDGRVPYLEVSDEVVDGLENGKMALAEEPEGRISIIESQSAERIAELDPMWLALWNRP